MIWHVLVAPVAWKSAGLFWLWKKKFWI